MASHDSNGSNSPTKSPFMDVERSRFGFRVIFAMLLMVVAAGLMSLLVLAFRIPAFSAEIRAWFGLPTPRMDTESTRRAQLIFATSVYAAPLGLGILVYIMHRGIIWMEKRFTNDEESEEDREFRMD